MLHGGWILGNASNENKCIVYPEFNASYFEYKVYI